MLTPSDHLVAAVDIGGTKTAVGLVNLHRAECVWSSELPTEPLRGPEHTAEAIVGHLRKAAADMGLRIEAIGIGCTGPVDPASGTVGDVGLLPGWNGYPLSQVLETGLNAPARLENDCDAAAMGEARLRAEKRPNDGKLPSRFLYVTISTGIGAGFLVDGEIYRGVNGAHPEMGHHTVNPEGPLCYCGSTGCWETLASGTAVASWYNRAANAQPPVAADEVFQRARVGDAVAEQAVERFTNYLGIGLANLITVLAPEVIVLGGGVMRSADQFLEPAIAIARKRSSLIPDTVAVIERSDHGRAAALIGAACIGAGLHPTP